MRRYNSILTNWLKRLITRKDLINTGKLLRYAKVYVINTHHNIYIDVVSEAYYIKYLFEDYMLEDLIRSEEFNEVVADLFAESVQRLDPQRLDKVKFIRKLVVRCNNEVYWTQSI